MFVVLVGVVFDEEVAGINDVALIGGHGETAAVHDRVDGLEEIEFSNSNDVITTDGSSQTMVNDETTAGGVGIAIRSRSFMGDFEEVKLSSSTSMGNATQILDIVKDDDIQDTQYILLHAYYRVYDASALSTGTVVATAQIMFGYD